jgi:hypothetical protein
VDIEARLQRLEDERAIMEVLYRYGHALDYGNEEAFMDCWHESTVLQWPGRAPIRGHAELRQAFRNHTHAPRHYHKHFVLEPLIDIAGDNATVTSMFARLDSYGQLPRIRAFGRYLDKFVRCADAKWRMIERIAEREVWRPEPPDGM